MKQSDRTCPSAYRMLTRAHAAFSPDAVHPPRRTPFQQRNIFRLVRLKLKQKTGAHCDLPLAFSWLLAWQTTCLETTASLTSLRCPRLGRPCYGWFFNVLHWIYRRNTDAYRKEEQRHEGCRDGRITDIRAGRLTQPRYLFIVLYHPVHNKPITVKFRVRLVFHSVWAFP